MNFGVPIPFVELLGFELVQIGGGRSEIHFEVKPEHGNSFAVAHGGAVMTLLDVSMATAARSDQVDMGVVTIEMKTSFMQPSRGKLRSEGKLMHRTTSLAFTQATIYDEAGRACAHATGTFKYVKRRIGSADGSTGSSDAISTD